MALNIPGAESVPQLIETVGQQAQAAINEGALEIFVDIAVKDVIGYHGMQKLVERYCCWNGVPGIMQADIASVRVSQCQDVSDTGMRTTKGEGDHDKKNRIPRPPNAFILYRQAHHPVVKKENPGLHNNEISVILGKQWRNESAQIKQEYYRLAQEMKDQHQVEHPDYIYKPRKTTEKKRRMSRKKAEKLAKLFKSMTGPESGNVAQDIVNAMEGSHAAVNQFNVLGGNAGADFFLLGDVEIGEKDFETLIDRREAIIVHSSGSNDNAGHILGNYGKPTGYVAPSTAIAIDHANDIIQWAEGHEDFVGKPVREDFPQMKEVCPGVPNHVLRRVLQESYDEALYSAELRRAERMRREDEAAEAAAAAAAASVQ